MKDLGKGALEVLKRWFCAVISTIGVLVAFGLVLDRLRDIILNRMIHSAGPNIILVNGIVGVPVHEGSHWLGCKLFGFKVADVELLRPVAWKHDGILGYVSHYSKSGWWGDLGNFVVGLAPMIFGSIFMLLVIRLVVPEVFASTKKRIDDRSQGRFPVLTCWWAAFSGFWIGLVHLRKWGILRGILCLYLVTSIAMHMSCSGQDIKNTVTGYGIVALIYLIYAVITAAIGNEYLKAALRRGGFIASLLSIGLIADGIMLLVSLLF